MEVYFVRHGNTDGNVAHRHQHLDTPLNKRGQAQAKAVAAIIKKLRPTYLITSTKVRAMETARAIGNECQLVPETYPAFEELRRPRFLEGERMIGKVTLLYVVRWFFGSKIVTMHDGETYHDFKRRVAASRRHLEALPPQTRVVVVSHGVFINFFVAHACYPGRLTFFRAALLFIKIITLKNTSITHMHFSRSVAKKSCGWRVVSKQ